MWPYQCDVLMIMLLGSDDKSTLVVLTSSTATPTDTDFVKPWNTSSRYYGWDNKSSDDVGIAMGFFLETMSWRESLKRSIIGLGTRRILET